VGFIDMEGNHSLTNGEHARIAITKGGIVDSQENSMKCLIGKVWTDKKIKKESFWMALS
jgi:hypothetical protein